MADAIALNAEQVEKFTPLLCDELAQSRTDAYPVIARVEAARELYKVEQPRTDKPHETACELVVPLLQNTHQALKAHFVTTLLGTDPIYQVMGTGREAKKYADNQERHMKLQNERRGLRVQGESVIDLVLQQGTCWTHQDFHTQYTYRRRFERQVTEYRDPKTGEELMPAQMGPWELGEPVKELTYFGPRLLVLEIDQAGTFPACNDDIATAPGAWFSYLVTGHDLLLGLDGNYPEYDKRAVEFLRKEFRSDTVRQSSSTKTRGITYSDSFATREFFSTPYEITCIYYRLPLGDKYAGMDWLIKLHEPSQRILYAGRTPWMSGARNLTVHRLWPDAQGNYGYSLPDLAGSYQQWLTRQARVAMDGAEARVYPELLVDKNLPPGEIEELQAQRGPGRFIGVDRAVLDGGIRPWATGDNPAQVLPFMTWLMEGSNEITGVNKQSLGQSMPGVSTATEADIIQANSSKLQMLQGEHLGRGLRAIGEQQLWLNYQFSLEPAMARQWMQANPDDQDQLEAAMALVPDGQYAIVVYGVTEQSNNALQARRADELFAFLLNPNSPSAVVLMKDGKLLYSFFTRWLRAKGELNPEEIIGTEEVWVTIFGTLDEAGQQAEMQRVMQRIGLTPEALQGLVAGGEMPVATPEQAVLETA